MLRLRKYSLTVALIFLLCNVAGIAGAEMAVNPASNAVRLLNARLYDAVMLKADRNYGFVRGGKVLLDDSGETVPYMKDGIAYAPLRFIAESQNSRIQWNEPDNQAVIYYLQYELMYTLDSNILKKIDSCTREETLITMPGNTEFSKQGRLLAPLEGFAAAAGFKFYSDPAGIMLFSHEEGTLDEGDGITSEDVTNAASDMFEGEFSPKSSDKILYVDAVNGRDAYDGSINRPLRTVEAARMEVRDYLASHTQNGNIEVYLRGGRYNIEKPLSFDEKDSGQNGYKVIYKAYHGEEPVISGGREVKGWQLFKDNIYRAYVGNGTKANMLFENDIYCNKARYPNEGYSKAVALSSGPVTDRFIFKEGDIPTVKNVSELEVSIWSGGPDGIWNWFQYIRGIKKLDQKTNEITLDQGTDNMVIGTNSRYFVQGAMEFLDAPGEFYFSKDGYLYYWPKSLPIQEQEIVFPVAGNILNIKGESPANNAHDIEFCGLTLRDAERDCYGIYMTNAARIKLDSCKINNIGGTVCEMYNWAQNNCVENCMIYNVGNSGIFFEGQPDTKTVINRYNVIKNNVLHDLGLTKGDVYGITPKHSDYNYIGHNRIYNSKRYGIALLGNKIGLEGKVIDGVKITKANENDYNHCQYNTIEYNDCFNCYTDSQDVGAINFWEAGNGNIIRNNLIHDNVVPFSMCFPIYLDDASDGTFVYNNVIYNNQNIKTEGTIEGVIEVKGINNSIFNNIVANNQQYEGANQDFSIIHTYSIADTPNRNIKVMRNITYDSGSLILRLLKGGANSLDPPESRLTAADYNTYFNKTDEYLPDKNIQLRSLGEWLAWQDGKYDQHSQFGEDPSFMDAGSFDYRLRYDSPVYKQGFEDINFKDIGPDEKYPFTYGDDPIERVFVNVQDSPNNSFINITAGELKKLLVTARTRNGLMADMKKATVNFVSGNPEVADVASDGSIIAKEKGIADITVSVKYGGGEKSTHFNIIVNDAVTALKMSVDKDGWGPDTKKTISLAAVTEQGRLLPVEKAMYTSSDETIASVDQNGIVWAHAPGNVKIGTQVNSKNKIIESFVDLNVKSALFSSFDYTVEKRTVVLGQAIALKLHAFDKNGKDYPVSDVDAKVEAVNGALINIDKRADGLYYISAKDKGLAPVEITLTGDGLKFKQLLTVAVVDQNSIIDEGWESVNYSEGTEGSFEIYKDGFFSLQSNGNNIWGEKDQCTYGYRTIELDPKNPKAEIIAEINPWPGKLTADGLENQSHMGVMIRSANDAGAKNVALRYWQTGAVRITFRAGENGASDYRMAPDTATPIQLRLVMDGGVFKSYIRNKADDPWKALDEVKVNMENKIMIGVCGYSGNKDLSGRPSMAGMFGNVKINVGSEVGAEE